MGIRILVCGSRRLGELRHVPAPFDAGNVATSEERLVKDVLDDLLAKHSMGISLVITGGAVGADELANRWARDNGIDRVVVPANWEKHGRAAGPRRNQLMLDLLKPDMVVAFPGGLGTQDVVLRARKAGIYVLQVPGTIPEHRNAGARPLSPHPR